MRNVVIARTRGATCRSKSSRIDVHGPARSIEATCQFGCSAPQRYVRLHASLFVIDRPVFVFAKGQWVAGVAGLAEKEADAQARLLAGGLD